MPVINVNVNNYFSVFVDRRRMNGFWIDFLVTILVIFYLNTCNFWMLYRDIKIVPS